MTTHHSPILGTTQIGLPSYGLKNTHGQPTRDEAFAILDAALVAGIDTFDTAYAYGTAEDVLGDWIHERALAGKVHVITKMRPHAHNDYPDGTKSVDVVRMELEKSLKRLRLESVEGYLFHSPYYIYMSHLVEGLAKMREEGKVKHIGVSIYDEAEALQAAEFGVDCIQVPYNAFDQRLDKTDFFETTEKKNITVYPRSPFLQGLLLMSPEEVPERLSYMRPYLERFADIMKRYNLSSREASLLFVREHCKAKQIVFGVETPTQLAEDISILARPVDSNTREWIAEMQDAFRNVNRGAVNASLWSKIPFRDDRKSL